MNRAPRNNQLHYMPKRRTQVSLGILAACATLTFGYLAHLHGRPVTAALLAVVAVTTMGALLGLRAGVLAGVVASVTYNLIFTDPYLKFSLVSVDDLVPIIALNISAIASGLIAGQLHDRAVAAERARRRASQLLKFSQDLQPAVTLTHIETILCQFLDAKEGAVTIKPARAEIETLASELDGADPASVRTYELEAGGSLGHLVIQTHQLANADLDDLLPILTLAVQRCALASEAAEAELLRRSEHFKTALLSSVSHDLRTPLAAIAASASSLASSRDKLTEATQDDLLQTIQEQCVRLDRLTTNILNLSRIEGGLDVEQMAVVDAVDALASALTRIRRSASTPHIERHFEVDTALVRADEPLLEQLFFNVLENAVIHTPAGTLIRVIAAAQQRRLVVSIRDEGPGIAEQDRERIFDRFYQGSRYRRRGAGAGLGLSIARGFAEAIGGTITLNIESADACGTQIDISLPLAGDPE